MLPKAQEFNETTQRFKYRCEQHEDERLSPYIPHMAARYWCAEAATSPRPSTTSYPRLLSHAAC